MAESKPQDGAQGDKFEIGAEPHQIAPRFSNLALINQTKRELIFDFCFHMSGQTHLVSRIALTPGHAKALYRTLGQVIEKFEAQGGPIEPDVPVAKKKVRPRAPVRKRSSE